MTIEESRNLQRITDGVDVLGKISLEIFRLLEKQNTPKEEKPKDIDKLLDTSLVDCHLSVRTINCLHGADIKTVRQLVRYRLSALLDVRNLGRNSIKELDEFVITHGLQWGHGELV